MPLDSVASRYAHTLWVSKVEEISHKYNERETQMRSSFAQKGPLAVRSGPFYLGLAKIGVEHIEEIADAKADSLLAAHFHSKQPLDAESVTEIHREVVEICESQGRNLAARLGEQIDRAGMPSTCADAVAATIASQLSAVEKRIFRDLSAKRDEEIMAARSAAHSSMEVSVDVNRAMTLAKVLLRDRSLEARDRKDQAVREFGLSDSEAYPGSKKFREAVDVVVQYMSDLTDAAVSSVRDAYSQTDTPLSGQTVADARSALATTLEGLISARMGSWQGSLDLVRARTGEVVAGSQEGLGAAVRQLKSHAARCYERLDSKLQVLLQTSLAAHEKRDIGERKFQRPPRTATVIRVLIASPSDVTEERKLLTEVVNDWNAANSAARGIVLLPIKWESHAYPATGDRPQGILNEQIVDDCDILIGVFWWRLGTSTGVAASGTVEEIERLKSRGKEVMLYFSSAPLPQDHDPEQWKSLKAYQNVVRKDTLCGEFKTADELYRLSSRHLASVINRLTRGSSAAEMVPPTTDAAASPPSVVQPGTAETAAAGQGIGSGRVIVAPISRSTSDSEYSLEKMDEFGALIRLPNGVKVRVPKGDYIESRDDFRNLPKLILTRKYFQGYFPGHEHAKEYFLPR